MIGAEPVGSAVRVKQPVTRSIQVTPKRGWATTKLLSHGHRHRVPHSCMHHKTTKDHVGGCVLQIYEPQQCTIKYLVQIPQKEFIAIGEDNEASKNNLLRTYAVLLET